MITPNSRIRLVKAPFEIDKINQLTFANVTAQTNYFLSLPYVEMDKATYQREDGRVRFNREYDSIIGYNYCMYQNTSYSNKWFYAFIEKIEYANDGVSFVYLKTDAFQTWQFNIQYKNTFVEREHVNDDTIGLHTIPEGLEHGEYVIADANRVTAKLNVCYIIVAVTWVPSNTPQFANENTLYNNIYSGSMLLAFRNADACTRFIKIYDEFSKADAINNIYMVPSLATEISESDFANYTAKGMTTEFAVVPYSTGIVEVEPNLTYSNVSSLNGYTPKNNKLKVYPYCYLSISNNSGTQVEFRYEDFLNNTPTFTVACGVNAGAQSAMIPKRYKLKNDVLGYDIFYTYGVTGGKYPTCSWKTDPYVNWLTQQAVNEKMRFFNLGADIVGGIATSDPSSALDIASKMGATMNEYYQHGLQSPTLEGQASNGDFCYSWGNNGFTYYKMCIRYEYARMIDNYFSMFGYKVNRVKVPNIFGRANWNYVKTIECNILGDIPQQDIIEIKNMFNNGVTFWHNPATFLDYSQNNPIV